MPAPRRLPAPSRGLLPGAPRGSPTGGDGLSPAPPPDEERLLEADGPYDFDESVRFVPFGVHDPCCRRAPSQLWRSGHTPDGPVTLQLRRTPQGVLARAWGGGAAWAVERASALAGLADAPGGLAAVPGPGRLARLARRFRGLRLPRSPWVFDGLCEYVLQQRVTFRDAARAHGRLVKGLGAPSPGPPGLLLPLGPADWLRLRTDDFRRAGVDEKRARTLRAAAREARRVDGAFALPVGSARRVLASIPGCGPWTVEIAMGFVLGDPDAVPTGDLHLPGEVGWALAGEPRADDARMLALLEPFRGCRFRLLRTLLAAGLLVLGRAAPRRAPTA